MSAGRKGWILFCLVIYAVINTGVFVNALVWAPTSAGELSVQIQPNKTSLALAPGEQTAISFQVINTGILAWPADQLNLCTVLPGNLGPVPIPPPTPQPFWSNANCATTYPRTKNAILPNKNFIFSLPLTAPSNIGWYRLYLQPTINNQPTGNTIMLNIQVGNPGHRFSVLPEKQINVSLTDQTMTLLEGKFYITKYVISTGAEVTPTPPGRYIINKKLTDVISDQPAHLHLPYWMELRDLNGVYEGYGIHGVPYQLVNGKYYQEGKRYEYSQYYSDGKLYEGYFVLGSPMSQGCVVASPSDAEIIFNWAAPEKTLVNIQ